MNNMRLHRANTERFVAAIRENQGDQSERGRVHAIEVVRIVVAGRGRGPFGIILGAKAEFIGVYLHLRIKAGRPAQETDGPAPAVEKFGCAVTVGVADAVLAELAPRFAV